MQVVAMASQGASLQNYNNELVKCLEDLREKRDDLNKVILVEEQQRAEVQKKIHKLTEQLHKVSKEHRMITESQ